MDIEIPASFGKGRFIVERELGRGGMGVVYEAFDKEREMRVALKTLLYMDADSLYYFKREFRTLHDIVHPNLCSFMELVQDQASWFLTMELVHGRDFFSHVTDIETGSKSITSVVRNQINTNGHNEKRKNVCGNWEDIIGLPSFDERRLRKSLAGLCEGLNAIHCAGKVHRDVKPSNVMITDDDRVVLLDFGLITEREVRRQTELGNIVGTAAYMAPEQATSEDGLGPAADWYAVGAMLYEVLTGKLPFDGMPLKIIMEKQVADPPKPSEVRQGLPKDLEMLCYGLLSRNPNDRPNPYEALTKLDNEKSFVTLSHFTEGNSRTVGDYFVGRLRELKTLDEAFRTSAKGVLQTVLIEGVSGVGKSTLVDRFTTEYLSSKSSTVILKGRCYEQESAPFKAFDGIVESIIRQLRQFPNNGASDILPTHPELLVRLFPSLRRAELFAEISTSKIQIEDPHVIQNRSFEAFKECLGRLGKSNNLVVIIDDMQWADEDSLTLLKHIVNEKDGPPILLILMSRFAKDAEESVMDWASVVTEKHKRIHLKPMDVRESAELARMYINRANRAVDVDPDLIAVESDGHPLYIAELVRHFTDNEVDEWNSLRLDEVIWNRVVALPEAAQDVLKIVCIAGTPVIKEHLQNLAGLQSDVFYRSISLLRATKLIRSRGPRKGDIVEPYHDRVRESVAEHVSNTGEASRIHYYIGQFLLGSYTQKEIEKNIFTVVQHLAAGCSQISNEKERARIAELYLIAGQKARQITAFSLAFSYLEAGISLLDDKSWQERYHLTLSLFEEAAEAAHLATDQEKVDHFTATVFEKARTILDKTNCAEIKIRSLFSKDRNVEATQFGIKFLEGLGLNIPVKPEKGSLIAALMRTKLSLLGKTDRDLLHLPKMTDERILATMRILSAMSLSAYITNKNLYAYFVLTQVRLIVAWGHSVFSSSTFCSYGLILCGKLGDLEQGYRFGRLALELVESISDKARECRVQTIANGFIFPYKIKISETVDTLQKTYRLGIESGDFQYALTAIGQYINQKFVFGVAKLEELASEIKTYLSATKENKQSFWWQFIAIHLHLTQNLIESVPFCCVLDGDEGSEQALLEMAQRNNNETCEWIIYAGKLMLHCYFGEFPRGVQWARKTRRLYHAATGTCTSTAAMFWEGIVYLRGTLDWRSHEGKSNRRILGQIRKELEKKARHAPKNFLFMVRILEAERNRLYRNNRVAAKLYDQGIKLAVESDVINAVALGNELAADFHIENGDTESAIGYATKAQEAYYRWGALAKVEHVRMKFGLK